MVRFRTPTRIAGGAVRPFCHYGNEIRQAEGQGEGTGGEEATGKDGNRVNFRVILLCK